MRIRLILAAWCLGASTLAQANWQEASSKHFIVYSDDKPETVKAFTTRLERDDKTIRVLHALGDPPVGATGRVTVFVVPSVAAVEKLAHDDTVAGFYIPRSSGAIAFVPRRGEGHGLGDLGAEAVLLHEYAHHLMYSAMGDAVFPSWLSEGFAEFHATTEFQSNGDVIVGKPPLYRAYGIVNGGEMPMATLLTATPATMPPDRVQMLYGRGWLLTHYLSTDEARRAMLTRYLKALADGRPAKDAIATLGDTRVLARNLNAYMRAPLPEFVVPARLVPIDPVTVRALTPGEAAVLPSRILSTRGVDARSAPGVVAGARKVAAQFPDDPAVQNELAEAEYDAGNPDAALAAADRALSADQTSVHAMMYAGMARIAAAVKTKQTDPKAFEAARGWIRRANRADPENAWPLAEYYLSFRAAGQAPTHNAEDGLLYARELAPFDPSLGLLAGYVDLTRGKTDDARRVLKPVAYDPHGGGPAKLAQSVLDTLDQKGATAAAAMLAPK